VAVAVAVGSTTQLIVAAGLIARELAPQAAGAGLSMLLLTCAEEESNLHGLFAHKALNQIYDEKDANNPDGIGSFAWQQSAVRTGFSS
jgi:hypothetical protein